MTAIQKDRETVVNEPGFVDFLRREITGRSVAIVGNSPRLLDSAHGAFIDSHDVVFRFNDADIAGLEADAGRKTTIRFVGLTIQPRHEDFFSRLQEDSIVITSEKNRGKIPIAGIRGLIILTFSIQKNAFQLADSLMNSNFAQQNAKPPRTGFALIAYLLALEVGARHISLFGMERTVRKTGRQHFYDNRSLQKVFRTYHKFHAELDVELAAFNQLVDSYPEVIQLH